MKKHFYIKREKPNTKKLTDWARLLNSLGIGGTKMWKKTTTSGALCATFGGQLEA